MARLNKRTFIGKAKRVEYHQSSKGGFLTFTVPVTYGKREDGSWYDTEWLDVALFGMQVEWLQRDNFADGDEVLVDGEQSAREYTKNDGTKAVKMQIRANTVAVLRKAADIKPYAGKSAGSEEQAPF